MQAWTDPAHPPRPASGEKRTYLAALRSPAWSGVRAIVTRCRFLIRGTVSVAKPGAMSVFGPRFLRHFRPAALLAVPGRAAPRRLLLGVAERRLRLAAEHT